jgi:hypothetical protein
MDTTLVTVTVLSMSMAAALSAIVWRMLRLERHRSNARVAALTSAARETTPRAPRDLDDLSIHPDFAEASSGKPAFAEASSGRPAFAEAKAGKDGTAVPARMFVERERTSPWGARVAVMAAVALAGASFVLFSLAARAPGSARRAAPAPLAAKAATTARPAATPAPGLELTSLRDARAAGSLTISGLVENPRTGTLLSRVTVTVYTFDDNGASLASGRALIDVTALEPGDESPFVVTVPASDAVARYRIGFRDESGHVIAHVDRRRQGPIASNW